MSLDHNVKRFAKVLVRSKFHAPLLALRSSIEYRSVVHSKRCSLPQTAFCASPYKTGTTYLAGRFARRNRVAHEPMHHTTIQRLTDARFFMQRLAYLGNAFECSGFLAGHLELIRASLPDARVIYLHRPFEDWLTSFISYFSSLGEQVRYNYVCRLLFDQITCYPVDSFFSLPDDAKHTVVTALLNWWLATYEEAIADPLCLLMPLHALDDRITEVEDFLRLRACRSARPWKRAAREKQPLHVADLIDLTPYASRIAAVERALPTGNAVACPAPGQTIHISVAS